MALNAYVSVTNLTGVSATEKLVLWALAEYADDWGGSAWPAVETIAARIGRSKRYTRIILRRLEANDLLLAVKRGGKDGRSTTSYRFLFMEPVGGRGGGHQILRSGSDPVPFDPEIPIRREEEDPDTDRRITRSPLPVLPPESRTRGYAQPWE